MVDGNILAAHYDCMAGLGETCSHVSSLLWVIAVEAEKRDALTVTQKSAYWVMPQPISSVSYAPIKEFDFICKKRKAAKYVSDDAKTSTIRKRKKIDVPTFYEKKWFLDSLSASQSAKPAVLSVISRYCDEYIPSSLSSDLPPVLTDLYKPSNLALSYYEFRGGSRIDCREGTKKFYMPRPL